MLPPTHPLRPIIPNNACTLRITAAAGTKLAGASSSGTVKFPTYSLGNPSSRPKELYDPRAFFTHAALLHQACAHCAIFPTPWHVIQNARCTPVSAHPTITNKFQDLLTLYQEYFSAFPHGTILYRSRLIFRVGSCCLPYSCLIPNRHYSWTHQNLSTLLLRDYHPLRSFFPEEFK